MRRLTLLLVLTGALIWSGQALAGGGNYLFDGGTKGQQTQVQRALEASAFDWNLVPARVTIHIRAGVGAFSTRGHIWLDSSLLDSGRFAWAVVQDEYAHQVDFFLFDHTVRTRLLGELGGLDWCYGVAGLAHRNYGCERFASTLVWSYWPSKHNSYRPTSRHDESASMNPARFRALLAELLPAPPATA